MLRHTFTPTGTRSTWFPLDSVTAKAPSCLQIRHLVSATSGRRHLGVIIAQLQCDRIRRARGILGRAMPLRTPGPKGTRVQVRVTRVTNSRVTRVTSTRVRVANAAISTGSTAVADPPGCTRTWLRMQGRASRSFSVSESNISRIPDGGLHATVHGWHDAANVAWRNAAGMVAVSAGESRRIHEPKFASRPDLG